jgi:3-methyladenine DNA glycosylase Mpg
MVPTVIHQALTFMGPGRLPSSLLIEAWNYSIDMFAVKHLWLELMSKGTSAALHQ